MRPPAMPGRFPRRTAFGMLVLALFTLFGVNTLKAQQGVNSALKRMQDHNKALQTLNATLRRVNKDNGLNIVTLNQTGELFYVPAENGKAYVRINWTDPDQVLLVVKTTYWLYMKEPNQYYTGKLGKNTKVKGVDALGFMGKSRKELADEYDTVYVGLEKVNGVSSDHLKLTPKARSNFKSVELWIDKDGMPVHISVTEKNDDTSNLSFSAIKKNLRLSADLFKWKPPSNAEKIAM